jgi:hypothetical protein
MGSAQLLLALLCGPANTKIIWLLPETDGEFLLPRPEAAQGTDDPQTKVGNRAPEDCPIREGYSGLTRTWNREICGMTDGKVLCDSLALIREQAPVCAELSKSCGDCWRRLPGVLPDTINQVLFGLRCTTSTFESRVEGEFSPQPGENVGQYPKRFEFVSVTVDEESCAPVSTS